MRIRLPLTLLAAAAVLVTGCGTADDPQAGVAVDHSQMDHGDGDRPDDAGARSGVPGTTEATIEQMRALDPERAAAAHQHDHPPTHGDRGHPNGVDPERIVIPAIGVDADVIDLGLQDDGTMEVPADFAQTGWFDRGPKPGRVGPAVIAGHVDSTDGPAVFFELSALEPGDEIEVHGEDGEIVTFAVRETQVHPKDDFPTEAVYQGTPGPELRLITCSGAFDPDERSYRDNTIVFAERVD